MWTFAVVALLAASPTDPSSSEPQPEAVTFDQAVDRALARNPTLATALEEVSRARALMEQARSAALPQLNGVGTYIRLDADRILQDRVILAANQLNGTLALTVPLVAGRAWANTVRASDLTEVQRALARDTRRLIALSTGRAFLTIIAQHRVVEVSERARDLSRTQLAFEDQRLKGGVGSQLDVTRTGQELQTAEAQLQNTLASLTRAREALGVLLGASGPVEAQGEPDLLAKADLGEALNGAETSRADVLAGRRRLQAAQRSSGLNWTDYLPLLSAVGQAAYQNPPTLTQPIRTWQVQLVLTLPIYDGGLRYGQAHERAALEREAQINLDASLRQARSDVRAAFEALRRADLALQAARDGARLAGEALKLAELAYRTGVSTNLEVVDAQRRARDADTAAAVAEDNARQARLDLLSASGSFPER